MPESATAFTRKRKLEKKAEKKRKAADDGGRKAKKAKCTSS